MKSLNLKKNQVIIFVIALMLISAGYLNYTANNSDTIATGLGINEEDYAGIGDAKLVNSNSIENKNEQIASVSNEDNTESAPANNSNSNDNQNNVVINENNNTSTNETSNNSNNSLNEKNDTVQETSSMQDSSQYYINSRLERDKMFSQMLESYEKILENTNISEDQKGIAQTEVKRINDLKNAIMISENLIKTKGFEDLIIFVNDTSISVIVKKQELNVEEIAQIQNIIAREMNAELENIHISCK